MKKLQGFLLTLPLSYILIGTVTVSAAILKLPEPQATDKTAEGFVTHYSTLLLNWMFTFLIIFSVVYVVLAAWKYLTAAGDSKKAAEARGYIWYAAIAVAIAILAKGVPMIVANVLGQSADSVTLPGN